MSATLFPLLAFFAGVAIAVQASLSAQLGVLLRNPLFAAASVFLFSFIFTLVLFFFSVKETPEISNIKSVPKYLWFSGGLLSALSLGTVYWLIPKVGASPIISSVLSGQLALALIAGHFGWFQLPETPITHTKVIGALMLILGVVFINKDQL